MNFIFPDWEYFGPGTDLEKAGEPISHLDRQAQIHDHNYAAANLDGGHSGRSRKAMADFDMAFSTKNPLVATALFAQGILRVFTFNEIEFPW